MKKTIVIVIAMFFTFFNALHAQSSGGEDMYAKLTDTTGKESVAALDTVLKGADTYQTLVLYAACSVAVRENRLEDAAYLLYTAELRARFDRTLFPPTGTGGDDPAVLFGALHEQLGHSINSAIMAQPKPFANALARVKAWNPKAADDYNPGWDYSKKGTLTGALAALVEARKQVMGALEDICALLQDDTYFAAFKICQAYNLQGSAARPSKEAYDSNLQTLRGIEKKKGIKGFAAMADER